MTHYALIMLAAGIGIPILAALNAALGRLIGSPTVAAVVLFAVALASSAAVMVLFSGSQSLSKVLDAPRHLLLAGVLIAFYVLTITHIAPQFGVGNAVFFVLLGQLISAAAIDHFGLFGAQVTPLGWLRAAGIAVMALGVGITQLA
ncbi:EamA-like transporter family protein [Epibacterium sp. SM1979]|uniref:EamA-like transporter family protein n=1 Tax=Tritonibacter litoralis TaxID=2662264 RepID=A0A843YED0_9RHOB|nr:EamA-like transporter family protein [Tritonibacter litoralis]